MTSHRLHWRTGSLTIVHIFLKPPAVLILQKTVPMCPRLNTSIYIRVYSPLTIQVHGDKDPDGFYRGECGGRLGYVPCNMVSEIQVDDEETRQQLLQQGFLSTAGSMEKIGRWNCLNENKAEQLHKDVPVVQSSDQMKIHIFCLLKLSIFYHRFKIVMFCSCNHCYSCLSGKWKWQHKCSRIQT